MYFKKILILFLLLAFTVQANANSPRSTGKYNNWESFNVETDKGKMCFAQTVPTKRTPSSIKRKGSRLFVTFRPGEKVKDEVSLTSGHSYKASTVTAKSGKNNFFHLATGFFCRIVCFCKTHHRIMISSFRSIGSSCFNY